MRPKCSLTWSKVLASSSRVSRSILRIASSSVVMASFRSAVLRVEEGLALARRGQLVERGQVDRAERRDLAVEAVDLALQAGELDVAVLDRLAPSASQVGLRPSASCSRYCSPPSRAACSLSWSSVMRVAQRLAARARAAGGCSSARAQLACVRSSYSLRLAPSAASRSSLSASASCRPACAAASVRRASSSRERALVVRDWPATCCAAVSIARCSSPRRAASARCANCASCAWRSSARCCSRAAASLRSAVDHALRRARRGAPGVSASCMSSSSKRASPVDAALLQLFELRRRPRPVRRRAARGARGSARPAASGAAARPAARARASASRRLRAAPRPGAATASV